MLFPLFLGRGGWTRKAYRASGECLLSPPFPLIFLLASNYAFVLSFPFRLRLPPSPIARGGRDRGRKSALRGREKEKRAVEGTRRRDLKGSERKEKRAAAAKTGLVAFRGAVGPNDRSRDSEKVVAPPERQPAGGPYGLRRAWGPPWPPPKNQRGVLSIGYYFPLLRFPRCVDGLGHLGQR